MTQEAREIYQGHLDTVSEALWARDFDRVAALMNYPHVMRSRALKQVVQCPEEMIEVLDIALRSMLRVGGTAYHRVCLQAEFTSDTKHQISGRHRVFLLRGGNYALDPFESQMNLILRDGIWLGNGIYNDNNIAHLTTLDPARIERVDSLTDLGTK